MKKELEQACEAIKRGGVILYPTDTIWGLGCDPNNKLAIEKLLRIKQRSAEKSLILLVHNEALLQRYVKEIPAVCYDLIDFAEKPLTLVYPNGQYVADEVLAADGSIAIRLTKDPFCAQLCQQLKSAVVSTSANISNQPYDGDLENLPSSIKDNVDYIVPLPLKNSTATPSQIIKIGMNGEVKIIRK